MTQILQAADVARRLLLIDSDRKRQKHVRQVLTRILGAPETRESLGELPGEGEYDLVVANYDALSPDDRARLHEYSARGSRAKVLMLSGGADRAQLSDFFGAKAMTNLLATTSEETVDIDALIVTCQKILRRDIFGIEKYFVWGVSSRAGFISSSRDKDGLLSAIQQYSSQLGIPQRLASLFDTVADEFVTNALYNSPVDAQGNYRFASTPRTQAITLEQGDRIEVKVCCDARRLGVSVADPYGSLAQGTILDYLAKCFRKDDAQVDDKPGGAGLGFYQILDALSHFVINIRPGKSTEMIGLIDVSGSYKDFVVKGKSFNIFVVDG
jgi:hypothetical protein